MPSVQSGRIRILLLGGSGLVGSHVLRQLAGLAVAVTATTRNDRPPSPSPSPSDRPVHWLCGSAYDLHGGVGPWPDHDVLLGTGPLDALASWLRRARPAGLRRVVALSSTSIVGKRYSSDHAEQALMARLLAAEQDLIECCGRAGIGWTLLRPTLIWGDGRDRNLSRLAGIARRFRGIVLPGFARGRRQPIHAGDVARAVIAAWQRPASIGQRLDLPGGEILRYDEMAVRIAAAVAPPGRVLRLPVPRILLAPLAKLRLLTPAHRAILERTAVDLVFDGTLAARVLDFVPAGFRPEGDDFPVR